MFSMQSVFKNPFIATFQLSSAASFNLGWSQNGVLGNMLIVICKCFEFGSVQKIVVWERVNKL